MYLSVITQEYACKNKLHESIGHSMKLFDRTTVADEDLPKLKAQINDAIIKANQRFSKCNPVTPDWWHNRGHADHFLNLPMLRMTFYHSDNSGLLAIS